MSKDIALWCKTYLRCQSSKVRRHQHTQLVLPSAPSSRFEALHVHVVGPLPSSRGYRLVFPIVDRYTRSRKPSQSRKPPLLNVPVLCSLGSPASVCLQLTSDHGRQFFSDVWRALRNAVQTFQRLMDCVLRGLLRVFVYIEDILVFSSSAEEHRADLEVVFECLQRYNLTIRPDKCAFGKARIEFLGFELSGAGLRPLRD
ncbi:hypothetical protein M514_26605 [Trichuris suis]|uniref:Reverse transcriptase domain-containing protein n=1 Tax=Trichuris suis TaxID=68888 RepID=A0A085MVH5_9BILA|nr:hypothetical protein M514_26605 [Trichuris suis]